MLDRKIFMGVLLLWAFFTPAVNGMAETNASAWPMFGHDARHTRQSEYAEKGFASLRYRAGMGDDNHVWQFPLASSPAVVSDPVGTNTIYAGAVGEVKSLCNDNDDCFNWNCPIETDDPFWGMIYSSPAIGSDGTIYVGSDKHYFYAIDPDGSIKWQYQTENAVRSSPVIASDGMIYVGSDDSYLYALDPKASVETRLKWRYKTNGSIKSSPAIGFDGTIYVGSDDHYLYAINPIGTLKWRYQTEDKVFSSPSVGSDGTIYVGSDDGYFYALNPNGSLRWRFNTGNAVRSSPAIATDGTIYVGSDDGYLYALNPNGTLKWNKAEAGGPYSPAISSDGTIICMPSGIALNPDGSIKWTYTLQSITLASSPVIGTDGWVYINGILRFQAFHLNADGIAIYGRVRSMATDKAAVAVLIKPSFHKDPFWESTSSVGGYYFLTLSYWDEEYNGVFDVTLSGNEYQTVTIPSVKFVKGDVIYRDLLVPTPGTLALTREAFAPASLGQPYQDRAWVAGGAYPYTFSVSEGSLPSWCALDSTTGAITGTPTAAGSYAFTIKVTDNVGASVEKAYMIYILPQNLWGDIDGDGKLAIGDVIMGLKALSRIQTTLYTAGSHGEKISLQGIIYTLQSLADLRTGE